MQAVSLWVNPNDLLKGHTGHGGYIGGQKLHKTVTDFQTLNSNIL